MERYVEEDREGAKLVICWVGLFLALTICARATRTGMEGGGQRNGSNNGHKLHARQIEKPETEVQFSSSINLDKGICWLNIATCTLDIILDFELRRNNLRQGFPFVLNQWLWGCSPTLFIAFSSHVLHPHFLPRSFSLPPTFFNLIPPPQSLQGILLVNYVGGGSWWPIQSPNNRRKKEVKG